MIIRHLNKSDVPEVKAIFALYWTDQEFLNKLYKRLQMAVDNTEEYIEQQWSFFIAEKNGEIIGVSGMRSAPDHMKKYAQTENPVEFYVLASKYKGRGIGEALRKKRMEEAKKLGFSEVVFYSPNSHHESWGFHDRLRFERVGKVIAPDGEPGMVWRKLL